jgi:type II secretory pathway component GspD/PulD (secretin)
MRSLIQTCHLMASRLVQIILLGCLVISGPAFADELKLVTPEPVTLSAKNLNITDLLTMLSTSRNLNIISSGEVTGQVSIDLHNVPFEQALKSVVAIAGFEVVKKDNIYFVRSPSGASNGLAAMNETRAFRLDYANPADVLPVVAGLISESGTAITYAPTRSIVVDDNSDAIKRVEFALAELDQPPRQVLIEARIIEARLSSDMSFGIDWSLIFSTDQGSGTAQTSGLASSSSGGGQGLYVNWSAVDFIANIEATAGVEELNTLSAPRLVAMDGMESEIIIGGQLGFKVVTTVENTIMESIEFLDTGAQLRLTPTITSDGYIMMSIHPELSDGAIELGLPSKSTTQVSTNVLVKDGETIFIGGLIRERDESSRKGIPLLKDIPLLGALFGRTVMTTQKEEIITLITPRIVKPGETITASNPFNQ